MSLYARFAIPILVIIAGLLYFTFKPEPAPTGVYLPAAPSPEVKHVEKTAVEIVPPLVVYKPEAKRKLKLPDVIQQAPNQHVIASTRTANDERIHTVTTVVDADTGQSVTLDRVEPLPWMAVSTKSQVGMYYGLKNGEQAVRLQAQQELLQVKALRVGAIANVDMTPGDIDTFVGVGVWARW